MGGKPKCTIEQVKEIANTKGFELLEIEYINNSTPMRMKCQHGHEFKISFQNLKKGRGCSYCYKYKKLTHDEVYKKCKEKGFELKTQYINANSKITVICKEGHDWETTWSKIQSDRDCPYCSKKMIHKNDVIKELESEGYKILTDITLNTRFSNTRLLVQCPLGHTYETTYGVWKSGCRCPHHNRSLGEEKVSEVLSRMKLEYITQYTFDNCKDINKLPFDFYIPKYNLCIEYDGRGHYEPIDWGSRGEEWAKEQFEWVKKHDNIKNNFCLHNGINLLRIPYWEDVENTIKLYFKENFNDYVS